MNKISFFIAFFCTFFIGLSIQGESLGLFENSTIFLLFMFCCIYLLCSGVTGFFHKIGKDAAKISRKEGSKYNKTLGSKYIRELPDYYTPALVSFIQDQAIEYNKDILGAILHLINNDYLKIENNVLVALNKNSDTLYSHEKYLYNCILNNQKVLFSSFKKYLIEDSYSLDLVKKSNNIGLFGKGLFKLFFGRSFYPFLIFVLLIILAVPFMERFEIVGFFIVFLAVISIPIVTFIGIRKGISYIVAGITREVDLTSKGKLDQEKIYMFKNFLKEFTSLDNKDVIEIHLWDEYLIYALILEVNKKIYEDEKLREAVNSVQKIIVSDFMNDVLS